MIDKKVVSVLLILCLTVTAVAVPVGVTAAKNEVKTIVIDPGHGGMDAGVSSAGGVKESDLVLTLSRILVLYGSHPDIPGRLPKSRHRAYFQEH